MDFNLLSLEGLRVAGWYLRRPAISGAARRPNGRTNIWNTLHDFKLDWNSVMLATAFNPRIASVIFYVISGRLGPITCPKYSTILVKKRHYPTWSWRLRCRERQVPFGRARDVSMRFWRIIKCCLSIQKQIATSLPKLWADFTLKCPEAVAKAKRRTDEPVRSEAEGEKSFVSFFVVSFNMPVCVISV